MEEPFIMDILRQWKALSRQKPTVPSQMQLEAAVLLSDYGIKAGPLSIYPVSIGDFPEAGTEPRVLNISVTFQYDNYKP